jgi:trehalose 6-phosphate synthase/phosphatase
MDESTVVPESNDPASISHGIRSSQIVPIYFNEETYKLFYNGMCNATLWPQMHSLPTFTVFKSEYWNAYLDVNSNFAHAGLLTLKKMLENKNGLTNSSLAPLIWIHDYHLMLMPLMLKNLADEETLNCRIAFFLHIPFPSWDIFRLVDRENCLFKN